MPQMLRENQYIQATLIQDGADGPSIIDVVVVGLSDADMPLLRRADDDTAIRMEAWWSLKRRMSESEKRRYRDLASARAEFDRFSEGLQIGQRKTVGSPDWPFRRHLRAVLNQQAAETQAKRELRQTA
jgi:murein DD-endopeptidase MepM/ murein hydrolase activator NlpD